MMWQKLQLMMMMVTITTAIGKNVGATSPERKRLRDDLLTNYDKEIIPNKDKEPIVVAMTSLNIQRMDVDEVMQQFVLHAWVGFEWSDSRLSWDPEKYGNISTITFSPKDVWMPDISFYNAVDPNELELVGTTRVLIRSNGRVLQVPPFKVGFSCVVDLTYWPNDKHTCSLNIGSWTHNGYEIDFKIEEPFNPQHEASESQWKIQNTEAEREEVFYECCPEPYVNLKLTLEVERRAPFYNWIIKAPAICLAFLTLVLFVLPPAATVKLTFGGVCLLLNLLFLVFTSSKIHQPPSETPLMIQVVIAQLVMATICVMVTAWVVRASTGPFFTSPPSSFYSLAITLAPAMSLSSYVDQTDTANYENDKEKMMDEEDKNNKKSQWILVGATFDRLAFGLHFLISITLIIRFFTVI